MKKELPKIFKTNKKPNDNNMNVYYVNKNIINKDGLTVDEKINKLFKSNKYVFNINVIIETSNKTYDTKIAGKIKNSIVTVDGETIPIIEIKDIIVKDRI